MLVYVWGFEQIAVRTSSLVWTDFWVNDAQLLIHNRNVLKEEYWNKTQQETEKPFSDDGYLKAANTRI